MNLIFATIFLFVFGVFLLVGNIFFKTSIPSVVIGVMFLVLSMLMSICTGLDYYESRIPTLQEQVQEYNIEVAELKLMKLREGLEDD